MKIGKCQKCNKENTPLRHVAIGGEVKEVCETCEHEQNRKNKRNRKHGPWCSKPKAK